MKILKLLAGIILCVCVLGISPLQAQSGDQILDGIGETGLIARYTLKENAKDWSRNAWHGSIQGSGSRFVPDSQFGKVLSLTGKGDSYISLPGRLVDGEESLSITAWVYLRSNSGGRMLFDFGKNRHSHFFAAPAGSETSEGFQVQIKTGSKQVLAESPAVTAFKWVHLAVVMDVPSRTLRSYVNGEPAGEAGIGAVTPEQLFDSRSAEGNKLYIGRSFSPDSAPLNAKLHDVRIYRIPLSAGQVALIHSNGLKKEAAAVRTRREEDRDLPAFDASVPQLYNAFLVSVEDVEVETVAGTLPRLPRYVKGVYQDEREGPAVRVLWPMPEDNSQVLKPGTFTITGRVPGTDLKPQAMVIVKDAEPAAGPKRTLQAFDLDQVVLNVDRLGHQTPFTQNRDKFISGLAASNPDNFLYMFRNAFGLPQPEGAKPLGVWDSQETKLRGHATGHYLSGLAQAYAGSAHNDSLRAKLDEKMRYMVETLYELSQMSGRPKSAGGEHVSDPLAVPPGPGKADFDSDLSVEGIRTDCWNWGKGFISAYPPDQFIMLENGAAYGRDSGKIWAPYYTLHKILAGLMDVYDVSGNEKALEIVKGMGDWVHARLSQLPTQTLINMWNRYIAGEFGGMNEAMARLHRLTGEPRYLETARLFDNIRVFFGDAEHSHGLAKNVDLFRGLHANQHIPQIVGALEIYRVSGMADYYRIADNFWTKIKNDYMYSIGGVAGARHPANAECFTCQPATLYENGFSAGGQNETCATYNMLKLTRRLFLYSQYAGLMDYYERGLYNHILASVAEETPANTYHVPLRPGSVKQFSNDDMSGFTCCNGTALENSTKLQNTIYFKSGDNQSLYVNLFVPSTLNWREKHVVLTQSTAFPKEDNTTLTIAGGGSFDLNIRVPHWAENGFFVQVNGIEERVNAVPGSYITLSRDWKDGDTVALRMPFHFYLMPVMDQPNIASLFYGPVLLAAQEAEPMKTWRKVTLNARDIGQSISGDAAQLRFEIDGTVFKPFYETYGRHSVYLDVTLKED